MGTTLASIGLRCSPSCCSAIPSNHVIGGGGGGGVQKALGKERRIRWRRPEQGDEDKRARGPIVPGLHPRAWFHGLTRSQHEANLRAGLDRFVPGEGHPLAGRLLVTGDEPRPAIVPRAPLVGAACHGGRQGPRSLLPRQRRTLPACGCYPCLATVALVPDSRGAKYLTRQRPPAPILPLICRLALRGLQLVSDAGVYRPPSTTS